MVEANPVQNGTVQPVEETKQESPATSPATPAAELAVENPATFERIKSKLEELKVPFKLT